MWNKKNQIKSISLQLDLPSQAQQQKAAIQSQN